MAHGFFGNLNENIVAKEKFVAMRDETMLITANRHVSGCMFSCGDKGVSSFFSVSIASRCLGVDSIEMLLSR
jgi:hypothetical protein